MSRSGKISKSIQDTPKVTMPKVLWWFLIVVANAANEYVVPQLHIVWLVGFTTVVINALIFVFSTYENQSPAVQQEGKS